MDEQLPEHLTLYNYIHDDSNDWSTSLIHRFRNYRRARRPRRPRLTFTFRSTQSQVNGQWQYSDTNLGSRTISKEDWTRGLPPLTFQLLYPEYEATYLEGNLDYLGVVRNSDRANAKMIVEWLKVGTVLCIESLLKPFVELIMPCEENGKPASELATVLGNLLSGRPCWSGNSCQLDRETVAILDIR